MRNVYSNGLVLCTHDVDPYSYLLKSNKKISYIFMSPAPLHFSLGVYKFCTERFSILTLMEGSSTNFKTRKLTASYQF